MDEDHPCRQCLDVPGCVAFSSAEAAWSHSSVTFPLPPAGLSKPDDIWQPRANPIFPPGAQQCQGAPALLQSGQAGDAHGGGLAGPAQALSDTCATCLPLLPAWDVTDVQGKLPAMMPVCFVPCDQQRGISAHGGSRSVWLQRHFAAGGEANSKQGSLECAKT